MHKAPSELSDQELLDTAKKVQSNPIIDAFLIGLTIGAIVWGVSKNNLSFFALIPIFIAFKVFHKPKNNQALIDELEKRNLN